MTQQTADLATFQEAARVVAAVAQRTPVDASTTLGRLLGVPVYLKAENLQRTGSFKVRGAYLRMARLTAEEQARGVVAASAGNHAQGVALAARELGISARIFMPLDAALPKVAATRQYGAEVVLAGQDLSGALDAAAEEVARTGRVLIHPYDHPDIVTGQGTIGLEIVEQVPDVRTVVVPTGGGGLLAGVAAAIHAVDPTITVVGVQAEAAATYPESLAQGHPVLRPDVHTMADGIAVPLPGEVPFGIIAEHVAEVRTVTEEELSRAVLYLVERAKLVVEPSGAAGVAALLGRPGGLEGPVVVILSGGNVDPLVLLRIIRHGMTAAGRYLQMRVIVQDAPGSLAALLRELAAGGGNVVSVEHTRTAAGLAVDEVEISVELETKGPEHCAAVLDGLRRRGYTILRP
ncbi:threonine ammonia-lyase [Georgenia thermotolerans]|uniref:threonine ammonia-lyase n=1 Tax=Georgenia thermotolerans TaxID=527326 RepID=UPI001D01B4CB|nr:threonine ammonia-lyase [Georgenia thermotolerans]